MRSRFFKLMSVTFIVLMLAVPVSAVPNPDTSTVLNPEDVVGVDPNARYASVDPEVYIILLEGASLASYRGGIPGLEATNPAARGETKLDAKSPASLAYLDYLANQHAQFIATMEQTLGRSVDVVYRYDVVLNGLAVHLGGAEAHVVTSLPGVISVQRETIEHPDTDVGPTWIGAPAIWDGSGVPGGVGTMGEGVIVGVLDTGINHDHPSFADVGGDGYDHDNPWGAGNYVGYCVTDDPTFCNDKLIGAWSYTLEPTSPEDTNGHGSHTSSTAAGNVVTATRTTPSGYVIERLISGVAPHANVIMYDVCDEGGCASAGSVAAVNQAVADGVDVINFSISGGNNPYANSVELAFLDASDAGVFVSTSAGNNGPDAGTVAHRSPWVSTVAAATHNRLFANSLIDMSGGGTPPADIVGQSITTGYGPAPIVYAGDFGDALCLNPFPGGTWTNGEIVVCDRGTAGRVEKGENVQAGGAAGYVLANDEDNGSSLVADAHVLPAVHITYDDGVVLKAWLASGSGHTATIAGTTIDLSPENGDIMASFSSRGPNTTFDALKPDMTAPGVAVLAAYMDGIEFEFVGGTSMASPHNAGAGALLTALYPSWSPAEIKSAIMTTASTDNLRKEDGTTPADPFDVGAGRDDLTRAAMAGLVFDETTANYQAANPALGGDPKTLNVPSLMDSNCRDTCSWSRTVESTLDTVATWTATADVPVGMIVTVEPDTFDLDAGATQQITVTADVSGLPLGDWAFGQVILTPSVGEVAEAHLPLAVVPEAAPPAISVSPELFDIAQRIDSIKTRPLDVGNSGGSPLEWEIYEDAGTGMGLAQADWSDNFDSYPTNTSLHGVGGWKGWGNDPAATAYTRDEQAFSAPNSVEIVDVSDLVHEYVDYTSGLWHYTAWQYIPTDFTGESYFILLNQYDDAGTTNNWSTQVNFNGNTNQVTNDGVSGGVLPLVRGQWMEIRVEIDLDNDTQAFYYGGDLLFQGTWTEEQSGGGILNIAAVDLWGNYASAVYYDDLSLEYQAQDWCDNFDSYPTDTSMHGVGGWKGWGNDPAATAYTRDEQARSAPNSVEIVDVSDLVHEFVGYNSGIWYFVAWQYIPTDFTGESYFILLNQYDDAGTTNNWSTQVDFNGNTNQVSNDGPAGGVLPLVRDQWMEIRVEIDLVNDIQAFYYGGDLLFEGSWTDGLSGGGILNIAAVDLWGNYASAVYYDDICLTSALPDICDIPSDIPWVSTWPISGTVPPGDTSTLDVTFDTNGLVDGNTYCGTLCVISNDPETPLVIVPLTMTVVLQDVMLSPESQTLIGAPGEMVTHTYTLTNTGLVSDSFGLSVADNSWPTSVMSTTGELGAGDVTTVDVMVSIPSEPVAPQVPVGSDTFTLTAVSMTEPNIMDQAEGTTIAEATPTVDLGADQASSGAAGIEVTYVFTVTNLGDYTDSFTLTLTGAVWTSTLSVEMTDPLAPGANQAVTLMVDIPIDSTAGMSDTVTLSAISMLDPAVSDSATATTESTGMPYLYIYMPIIVKNN